MKQTNNAIKFLLAQYRAIFKHAYLKGIASSVALTACLAAGAANAANDGRLDAQDFVNSNSSNATTSEIIVSSSSINLGDTSSWDDKFEEGTGAIYAGDITLSGSGAVVNVTGAKDRHLSFTNLTIQSGASFSLTNTGTEANTHIYGYTSGSPASGSEGKFTVSNSQVSLSGASIGFNQVDITSGSTITLGGGVNPTTTEPEYIMYSNIGAVKNDSSSGSMTIADSNITLNDKSNLNATNTLTIQGASTINFNGTSKEVTSGVDYATAFLYTGATDGTITISGSKEDPAKNPVLNIQDKAFGAIYSSKLNVTNATINIGSGSTLFLDGIWSKTDKDNEGKHNSTTITLSGDVTVNNTGTLYIGNSASGSTVNVTGNANIDGSIVNFAQINVSGSAATLSIDADQLSKDNSGSGLFASKTDGTKSGSVLLTSGGTFNIEGTDANNSFDLSKLTFSGSGTAVEGVDFTVSGSGTIAGDYLTVSEALKNGTDTTTNVSGDDNSLNIEAENLTLGGATGFTSANTSLGFASATARNVVFNKGSETAFTLQDDLNLSAIDKITNPFNATKHDFEYAGSGTITGDVIVSGSQALTIEAGHYTNTNSITLSSGGLTVGVGTSAIDASLVQKGDFIVNNTNAQTILVSGNGNITFDSSNNIKRAASAVLDLSQANLDITRGDALATFKAVSGSIIIDEDQVEDIFNLNNADKSGAGVLLGNGGVLEVKGTLSDNNIGLDVGKLTPGSSATSDVVTFSGAGLVKADTIWLQSTATTSNLNIGSGFLQAETIRLDQTAANSSDGSVSGDFIIEQGTLEVGSSLTSSNSKGNKIVLGNGSTGATLHLGYIDENTDEWGVYNQTFSTSSDTGSVNNDLVLSGGSSVQSEVVVLYGTWNAKNIDITSGSLTVGDPDEHKDQNGNPVVFNATLNADKLTLNTGSKVDVKSYGTANFDSLTMSNGSIAVSGSMTVSGDYVAEKEGTPASYGVAITGGTIQVSGRNASLTFGNDAVQAITVSGDKVTAASNTFKNNITVDQFATLKLDFGKISFSDAALKELRKTLLAGNTDGTALDAGYIDLGNASIAGITVGSDGTIKWDDLSKYKDITDIKTQEMSNATLVNVDGTETVNANVGNIQAEGTTQTVNLGDTVLSNANAGKGEGNFIFNADDPTTPINANITSGAHVTLENGGNVGSLTLSQGQTESQTILNIISSGEAVTNIKSISADVDSLVNISGKTNVEGTVDAHDLQVDQALTVGKNLNVTGDLTSSYMVTTGSIKAQRLDVTGDTEYSGNLDISGKSTFNGEAYLGGYTNTFGDTVTFEKGLELDRGITTAKTIQFKGDPDRTSLDVVGYAQLTAEVIEGTDSTEINITVGEEAGTNGTETWDSAPGYLTAGRIDLNGGVLTTDPEYGKAATIVAVGFFGQSGDYSTVSGNEAGILDGQIIALRNSIVGIGVENGDTKALDQIKSSFSRYFDANGSLNEDNVGAIAYVAKALDVDATDNSKIIVDSDKSFTTYKSSLNAGGAYNTNIEGNNIYLGKNSVLAISDYAALDSKANGTQRAAINFTNGDASLYAEADAKIVLVGDGFSTRDKVMLFNDKSNNGIEIKGNDVTVETINGLLSFTLEEGEQSTGDTLSLNRAAVSSSFSQASGPVKYSLIAYAANDNNWADTSADHKVDQLHGDIVAGVYSDDGKTFYKKDASGQKTELTDSESEDLVAIGHTEGQKTTYTVYMDGYNSFLDNVVRNSTSGIEAEQAARLAVFGGAAQAAISAGATTYDAISGRMGVGAQTGSITFANNGQGAGLWVTPVYKNHDSDDFGAQGASYGVDMDMYGVALGGDFTLANGLRVGAAFNVGSGDADGQGTGAGVSNDFDYYGFAVYGGFTYDKLSIVGDVSYTVVDNDVEANTSVDKLTASMDSANLSVGVTGQYSFDYNGLSIVPHAGLRYTNIDLDDYTVKGSEDIAHFDGDSVNIFSIPVGVTFSKDYTAGDWTIKPAFDLTLTANMGDDSIEGTVAWANISNMNTKVESEVLDDWTYGATLGVSAQSGNFSLGFGVNYTGASSADEYGVGANARFVF